MLQDEAVFPWDPEETGEIGSGDPRAGHAALYADLAEQAARMLLPLPRLALQAGGATIVVRDRGNAAADRDWDEGSVLSWSQSPRRPDGTDEAQSATGARRGILVNP